MRYDRDGCPEGLVIPSGDVMDQVTPAMTAEVRMIRAAERAAIVAWLRTLPAMQHPGALAAAIERGEHMRPRDG